VLHLVGLTLTYFKISVAKKGIQVNFSARKIITFFLDKKYNISDLKGRP